MSMEHSDYHQDDIHEKEQYVLVTGDSHQCCTDCFWDSGVCHNEGHRRGCRDQEQDGSTGACGAYQYLTEGLPGDALITDGEDQRIQYRYASTLSCGEDTTYDTTDYDRR